MNKSSDASIGERNLWILLNKLHAEHGECAFLASDNPYDGMAWQVLMPTCRRPKDFTLHHKAAGRVPVIFMDRMEHYGGHADKSSSAGVERYIKPFRELMGHGSTLVLLTHQTQYYKRMEGHQSLEGSKDRLRS